MPTPGPGCFGEVDEDIEFGTRIHYFENFVNSLLEDESADALSRLGEGIAGRVAAKLMAPDIMPKEEPSLSLSTTATSQLAWHPV